MVAAACASRLVLGVSGRGVRAFRGPMSSERWHTARRGAGAVSSFRPRPPNGHTKELAMIVVTNRIPVAEAHRIDFEDRFKRRAHLVDRAPGFIRNEVHRPRPMKFSHETGTFVDDAEKQGYYEVKTWWRSMEDFTAWTKSPAFAEAHANRAPKEMFAGPSELLVHEVFLSTDLGNEGAVSS
jgi:heme-degrading monooxygenase HmoA